jgi:hypothetical protein
MVTRALLVLALLALAACDGEVARTTDVFVSIDALDTARAATSVRVQVDEVVVELPRSEWPIELVVLPRKGRLDHVVQTRAWAMTQGAVLGAARGEARFRDGERFELALLLLPGADVGPLPDVNAVAEPGVLIVQPSTAAENDAGLDGGSPGPDGSTPQPEGDGGTPQGSLTPLEFCERLTAPRRAWKTFLDSCCSGEAASAIEYDELLNSFGTFVDLAACESWISGAIADPQVTYRGEHAAACVDVILTQRGAPQPPASCPSGEGISVHALLTGLNHGYQQVWQIPACRQTFAGALAQGATCTTHGGCSGSLMCFDGTCQPPRTAGQPCAGATGCKAGLYCIADVCSDILSGPSQACSDSYDCVEGLRCNGATCVAWETEPERASSGETCSASFDCHGYCNHTDGACAPFCAQP